MKSILFLTFFFLSACSSANPSSAGIPNFAHVNTQIMRGGQPTGLASYKFLEYLGVTTIVKLNEEDEEEERDLAAKAGIFVYWFPISLSDQIFGGVALEEQMRNALRVMRGGQVTFVHCENGWDRTGLAIGRLQVGNGMLPRKAYAEMESFGFHWMLLGLYRNFWRYVDASR